MKLEIIDPLKPEPIKIYAVPDLSMFAFFDFEEWKNTGEIVVDLNSLSNLVADLDPGNAEIQVPEPSREAVDFYIPDPLKNSVLSQFARLQTEKEKPSNQFADRLNEVTEEVLRPALRPSTILTAVVTEILQNHHQRSDYKVRISDG